MLTASFCFSKAVTEEGERSLWGRGITSWELAMEHRDEVAAVLGAARAGKFAEQLAEAQAAVARGDGAWLKANWPERELWRLWRGWADPAQTALVDIETTGLTPGFDQITVIGLADAKAARVFVAGKPQPGDEPLERFPDAIRPYRLIVTFNGDNFDLPFIAACFRERGFRWEIPHLDLLWTVRHLGLSGGLKDIEKQLGIQRGAEIQDLRGNQAIQLWARWRAGDADAYRQLTTYCKADCANLREVADRLYERRWAKVFAPFAKQVDFAAVKGKQLSLFG